GERRRGPLGRLTQVIDPAPEKLARIRRIVTQGQPNRSIVAVLGAENLTRRLLLMRGQNLILTIILADYVENVRQSIVVIMTDVRPKERLRDRARRIAFVERSNQRSKDLFCKVSLRRVMNFIAGVVDNHAGVVAMVTPSCAQLVVGRVSALKLIVVRIF